MRRFPRWLLLAPPILCLLVAFTYNLPPVHDRLAWRLDNLRARVKYALNPPQQVVFVPQEQVEPIVQATLQAMFPTPSSSPTITLTPPGPSETPAPSPTATSSPTPLPQSASLNGIKHEYQKWNNCGPATLSMALSYWGWKGSQDDTAAFLKPNPRDKNVMPYELEAFVNQMTDLKALVRVGGDREMLQKFIAAGFPVMVEKGFEGLRFEGWMGHYEVLVGYDNEKQQYTVYDSFVGPDSDFPIPYQEVEYYWQHFNYTYLVIYPPDRENEVLALLGPQADETYNLQYAAQKASDEIYSLSGREQFFAWYNRGSNLVRLQDFAGAAEAYDQAFSLYPSIPEDKRPWRMVWYQTGPYFAYYYTGRYYDVIGLADKTIGNLTEPAIEESFYWRGMARAALGDTAGAIEDFRLSLEWHQDFEPSMYQLSLLGEGN